MNKRADSLYFHHVPENTKHVKFLRELIKKASEMSYIIFQMCKPRMMGSNFPVSQASQPKEHRTQGPDCHRGHSYYCTASNKASSDQKTGLHQAGAPAQSKIPLSQESKIIIQKTQNYQIFCLVLDASARTRAEKITSTEPLLCVSYYVEFFLFECAYFILNITM